VQQLSESGLEGELLTLLGHVGATTEPNELPSIMHTLHTSGMAEAADAVVDAAAARPAPVVFEIALKLHDSGLRDALGRLLSAARTSSQG
jgi:D-serine deaminase-like pyridoxal phosphate-dependent protein